MTMIDTLQGLTGQPRPSTALPTDHPDPEEWLRRKGEAGQALDSLGIYMRHEADNHAVRSVDHPSWCIPWSCSVGKYPTTGSLSGGHRS